MMLSMRWRNSIKCCTQLLLAISAILALFAGCASGSPEGLSFEEIQRVDLRVPVHHPDSATVSTYGELSATYFYSEPSEVMLVTYFTTENSEHQIIQVARLTTCLHCGQLVDTNATRGDSVTPVVWASGTTGSCRPEFDTIAYERFVGEPFQSCLYWMDEQGFAYKLYTIWSEEMAVAFANSLVVIVQ